MTTLYLCYQSVTEPLTQTQVVNYLEGLARAGIRVLLLTFEPTRLSRDERHRIRKELLRRGIRWYALRYHKRPTVPATAWDLACGIAFGFVLALRHKVNVFHARAHVPGIMAAALKRLTGGRLLFDIRGFMAEEYADGGVWPDGGALFRLTKRVEKMLVGEADAVVVLTMAAERVIRSRYAPQLAGKPLAVIPCCVDRRHVSVAGPSTTDGAVSIAYVGKLGGWYWTEALVDFFEVARSVLPGLELHVWSQSDPAALRELLRARGLCAFVRTGSAPPAQLGERLSESRAAVSFLRRTRSAVASSPTKVGDCLAAGLPIVCSAGVGDVDELLEHGGGLGRVGISIVDHDRDGYRRAAVALAALLREPGVHDRCRAVAAAELDLVDVGWSRYLTLYQRLGAVNESLSS